MCNSDGFILNPLFNFEPMKGLEYCEDVRVFRSAGNGIVSQVHFEYVEGA